MRNILYLLETNEEQRQQLQKRFADCSFTFKSKHEVSDEEIRQAECIIGNLLLNQLDLCENAKLMQLGSAGSDAYAAALNESVTLCNASGCYGPAISEYMIGVCLSLMLRLPSYRDQQHLRAWQNAGKVSSILGSKVLIVGLGDIGSQFAIKMRALGAKITGIRRNTADQPDFVDAIAALDQLDELLPEMDIIASCLPNSKATEKVFTAKQFKLMKDAAIFINVGRGQAVDTDALCDALKAHEIYGAALDVVDPEPLPLNHPLWNCGNLLLTPHIAGGSNLKLTTELIYTLVSDNLEAYLKGEPLKNVVDRATGYRKHQ
ncbi:D-2-hydroxyacid dehydrogenase [Dielma fastidiosa]|uniref:D-2-hydroxyacid dehydrogenase n=1 Tax=Dielma fastidiosa TaxID=1034346 RepID=A0AB35UNA8_9FIRM|nr:D-2-hydroxyacid dehydrogenase [Dielma fastidiosa]MDY5168260.1 D-2-hydroxyacid dehydrogenase [Dielma fastidiosa]